MSEAKKLELKNPQDGLVFNAKEWSPAEGSDKNALVVIVHGFGENVDDYESFAKELSSNGYRVAAFDQRGFGKTARTRKDYGISNEYYVFEDLDAVLAQVTKGFEGHVILFGHSMGGGITLNYLVKGKLRERIDSYVVTGPFVETHPYTSGKGLNKLLLPFMPLVVKFHPKLRRVAAIDPNVLSHDQEVVKEIAPQVNRRFLTSAQLMNDCIVRGKRLENSVFVGKAVDRPVLVCHGTGDKVTNINATRTFCSLLKVKKSRFLEYDGAYHTLHRESPEYREKFLADLYKFLGEVEELPTHYVAPKPEEEASAKEAEETEAADKTEDKTEAAAESSKAADTEAAAPVIAVTEPETKEAAIESKEPEVETKEPAVEAKEPVVEPKEAEPESVPTTSEPVTEETKAEVPAEVPAEETAVEQTKAVEEKPAETVETVPTEVAETAETAQTETPEVTEVTEATKTTETATEATEATKATEVEEQASKDDVKPETAADAKETSEEPSGEDTPEPESQEDKPAEQKTTTGGGSASKKKNNKKKNKKKGKK